MKGFKSLSQGYDLIDEVSMGYNHAAATIALQTKIVENMLGIFSKLHSLDICLVDATDNLSTCEAPDWDLHLAHL